MIILILGGARSGKSSFAEKVALVKGGTEVIYLATAEIRDEEMKDRVNNHQQKRPSGWETVEEPYRVSKILSSFAPGQVVLLDCLTLLVSNLLLQGDNAELEEKNYQALGKETDVVKEIEAIVRTARQNKLELIIVSNEVGQGLVSPYKLGRDYRDVVGRANQLVAKLADEVYYCVAGLPIEIKEMGRRNLAKFNGQQNDNDSGNSF